jgi:hypothetical protein
MKERNPYIVQTTYLNNVYKYVDFYFFYQTFLILAFSSKFIELWQKNDLVWNFAQNRKAHRTSILWIKLLMYFLIKV